MYKFNNTPTKTKLTHHGSFGGSVEAFCDACDEAVSWVNYTRSGSDFVITKFGVHPRLTALEAQHAGNLIDSELAKEASLLGVTKLFLIHVNDRVELVRTYEPHPAVMNELSTYKSKTQYLN